MTPKDIVFAQQKDYYLLVPLSLPSFHLGGLGKSHKEKQVNFLYVLWCCVFPRPLLSLVLCPVSLIYSPCLHWINNAKIVHKSPPSFAPPTLHSMISLLLLTLRSSFSPHVLIICLAAFLQPRAVSSPVFLKWWSYRPLEGQSWASPFLVESGKCMCLGPCSFSLGWLFSDFSPCPSLMRFCLMVLPHHLSLLSWMNDGSQEQFPLFLYVILEFLFLFFQQGNILFYNRTHNKYISKLLFKMNYCFKVNLEILKISEAEEKMRQRDYMRCVHRRGLSAS